MTGDEKPCRTHATCGTPSRIQKDCANGSEIVRRLKRRQRRELHEVVEHISVLSLEGDDRVKAAMDYAVTETNYYIIGTEGTWFGVGAGLARIAQAIEDDERALITCSMLTPECQGVPDVALSLPRVLGAGGVVRTFTPELDSEERAALKRSAEILKEAAVLTRACSPSRGCHV